MCLAEIKYREWRHNNRESSVNLLLNGTVVYADLTIIPRALMGYWLRAHEVERNDLLFWLALIWVFLQVPESFVFLVTWD